MSNANPKILIDNSPEYLRLEKALRYLRKELPNTTFQIKNILFEAETSWVWTTIIATFESYSWQYLTPRRWSAITNATNNDAIYIHAMASIDDNQMTHKLNIFGLTAT